MDLSDIIIGLTTIGLVHNYPHFHMQSYSVLWKLYTLRLYTLREGGVVTNVRFLKY